MGNKLKDLSQETKKLEGMLASFQSSSIDDDYLNFAFNRYERTMVRFNINLG
ncbi:MAG: hypothetical protein AABW47_01700 [Nanoarchaeota archaeon]